MEQQSESNLFNNLIIDREARQHIQTMSTWATVVVIIAGIGYLFNILELVSPSQPEVSSEGFGAYVKMMTTGSAGVGMTIIGLVIGIVINYFLLKFSLEAKRAVMEINTPLLSSSFSNLKNYFLITTIYIIVVILYFLSAVLYIVYFAGNNY